MQGTFRPRAVWAAAIAVIIAVAPAPAAPQVRHVPPPAPPASSPLEPAPGPSGQGMGPGEDRAKEAALLGAEDWIAEVLSHSPDWRAATIKIGPPQSKPLLAISLKWDAAAGYYDVVGEEELP